MSRDVRFAVDCKVAGSDWVPYAEGPFNTVEEDPNAIALAVAVSLGVPPGTGAHIAWNSSVRVRVWTGPDAPAGEPTGEYVYDALAEPRARADRLNRQSAIAAAAAVRMADRLNRQSAIAAAAVVRMADSGIAAGIAVAAAQPPAADLAAAEGCNCLHHKVGGFPYPCRKPS